MQAAARHSLPCLALRRAQRVCAACMSSLPAAGAPCNTGWWFPRPALTGWRVSREGQHEDGPGRAASQPIAVSSQPSESRRQFNRIRLSLGVREPTSPYGTPKGSAEAGTPLGQTAQVGPRSSPSAVQVRRAVPCRAPACLGPSPRHPGCLPSLPGRCPTVPSGCLPQALPCMPGACAPQATAPPARRLPRSPQPAPHPLSRHRLPPPCSCFWRMHLHCTSSRLGLWRRPHLVLPLTKPPRPTWAFDLALGRCLCLQALSGLGSTLLASMAERWGGA